MANNFMTVGDEAQVNLAPHQNGDQLDADVATLSDGRFFVAFSDDDTDVDIIGQFVNADGTLSGGNIDIAIGAANQKEAAVAARAGGGAVVVWQLNPAGDIEYAVVSNAGAVGAPQTILDNAAGDFFNPDVATLADGRSLVVAEQISGDENIVFRFIDADGNPTGTQDFVDNDADDQSEAAVAAFGNTALVVYEHSTATGDEIHARFFDGTNFGAEFSVSGTTEAFNADVAALADGRFVVVWQDEDTVDIFASIIGVGQIPIGTPIAISGPGLHAQPRVAGLPDGGFIVTWTSQGDPIGPEVNASFAIHAQRFDSTGAPAGDVFLANAGDPDNDQVNSAIAANSAGQVFVAWEDEQAFAAGDSDPDGIRGRGFQITTDIVNGTAGDDIITTFGLGETINALEGDDLVNALGGNDIVHGGAGFDQIKGGAGDDQLFGEGGEDLLKGEDGNDLLVGGLGRDVQLGGAGSDTFDFNKTNESRVGANHDVIVGFKHSEHDRIDLKTIDADTTAGGNQAFDLIGTAAFSGTAGELRFAGGLLQGDVNGDGIADLEVRVTGLGAAVNGDFVL